MRLGYLMTLALYWKDHCPLMKLWFRKRKENKVKTKKKNMLRFSVPRAVPSTSSSCGAGASSPVMQMLLHPTRLSSSSVAFRSEEWRRAMCTLYRVILKLHAIRLQPAQRDLGDKFVRAEFQRHRMANEKYATLFYSSWYGYVAQLESGVTSREMTAEERSMLSDDQKGKLAELRSYVIQKRQTDGDFVL